MTLFGNYTKSFLTALMRRSSPRQFVMVLVAALALIVLIQANLGAQLAGNRFGEDYYTSQSADQLSQWIHAVEFDLFLLAITLPKVEVSHATPVIPSFFFLDNPHADTSVEKLTSFLETPYGKTLLSRYAVLVSDPGFELSLTQVPPWPAHPNAFHTLSWLDRTYGRHGFEEADDWMLLDRFSPYKGQYRYYVLVDHHLPFIFVSNGPNGKIDIDASFVFDVIAGKEELIDRVYDPSNGIRSDGDIIVPHPVHGIGTLPVSLTSMSAALQSPSLFQDRAFIGTFHPGVASERNGWFDEQHEK